MFNVSSNALKRSYRCCFCIKRAASSLPRIIGLPRDLDEYNDEGRPRTPSKVIRSQFRDKLNEWPRRPGYDSDIRPRNPFQPPNTGHSRSAQFRKPTHEKNLPYYKFDELLRGCVGYLIRGTKQLSDIVQELGLESQQNALFKNFTKALLDQPPSTYEGLPKSGKEAAKWRPTLGIPSLAELKSAYDAEGKQGLNKALVKHFGLFASFNMLSPEDLAAQRQLADMSRPAEWYPAARSLPRKLHLHVGPTNSGKTYHALQRLQKAESGCFAGPLRLLAFEIYDRFQKAGVPCNLLTGEERRFDPEVTLTSSTIEMANFDQEIEVMVIDEIQMIADKERGSAWTAALLGAPAREIHMCGEASVVELIQSIAKTLGETVEVHNYTRLGVLEPMTTSLGGDFNRIEEGDAVVTFSRKNIFEVKNRIEQATRQKCAVVYGGLPPETRAAQANLFNDPESEFKVMVASDAIGMGLNLSIKRVVFEALVKWNGKEEIKLPIPQVKQIAGRAGRFKPRSQTAEDDALDPPKEIPGYVTTLREQDLPYLHEALITPTIQLKKAILRPPVDLVEKFVQPYPRNIKMSMVMQQLQTFATTSSLFEVEDLTGRNHVLDLLEPVKRLSFPDRWSLMDAPLKSRDPNCVKAYLEMVQFAGDGRKADLLDLADVQIDLLDEGIPETQEQLQKFESLHSQLTLYLWLSQRFPGVFVSMIEVYQLKQATEELIAEALERLKSRKSTLPSRRHYGARAREMRDQDEEEVSWSDRPRKNKSFASRKANGGRGGVYAKL